MPQVRSVEATASYFLRHGGRCIVDIWLLCFVQSAGKQQSVDTCRSLSRQPAMEYRSGGRQWSIEATVIFEAKPMLQKPSPSMIFIRTSFPFSEAAASNEIDHSDQC